MAETEEKVALAPQDASAASGAPSSVPPPPAEAPASMATWRQVTSALAQTHPETAAHILENMEEADAAALIREMDIDVAGPILERLHTHAMVDLLEYLGPDGTKKLLEAVSPQQSAVVLKQLDGASRQEILDTLSDEKRIQILPLVEYPPDTAGGMMETQVTSIPENATVQRAIEIMRRAPKKALYYLYVTDRDRRLLGVLNMRDLLLANPQTSVGEILHRDVVHVHVADDREPVAEIMRQHRFMALPVLDDDNRLLGVIRPGQVLHAAQQEAFEDLQIMVGAGGEESPHSPVFESVRKRLPWLFINLLTAFAAAAVVGQFEGVIAKVTALAVLLPIVAGQSGNSGAQALAVAIRGLALKEIISGTARRVLLKEMLTGLVNGVAIAVVAGIGVTIWDGRWQLGLVIALAMVASMGIAGIAGAAIPIALQRLGQDPAQSSSIFLTTVTDVVGFATFLGLAAMFAPLLT